MAEPAAAPDVEKDDVDALWRALYCELLRKTLDNLRATPAEELSAATISAVRGLLDANKVNRDEFLRTRLVDSHRQRIPRPEEFPFPVPDEVPFR